MAEHDKRNGISGSRRGRERDVVIVSSDSSEDDSYRAPRQRLVVSRRNASLSRSPSRSPSASPSPAPSRRSPSRSPSPPPHPLSSYRACMTCMHRLSKRHFAKEQWALAKEHSQCKECEEDTEGRSGRRQDRSTKQRASGSSSGIRRQQRPRAQDKHSGVRNTDRAITRGVWSRESVRDYRQGEEGEVIEEVERDEIMIDDDDEVDEMQMNEQTGRASPTSKRAKQSAYELQLNDGAQTEMEDNPQRRRRGRRQNKDDEAENGGGRTRKRRRRRGDSDAKRQSAKKKRKYNLAPEYNPYNRNFTAQHGITNSRSGRLGASADTNTPPPPPLQPDLIAFLRLSFGVDSARDSADHKNSTQVNAVFAKQMEQTGTLHNGKVYVAVSSANSLDVSVGDSDEEGTASVRRTRQREKKDNAAKGSKSGGGSEQWQPMLGLFAGRDIEKDEVVTAYGGVLVDGDDARRRHASTYTHIRRIRDSRMVRDGRLFSALFDRSQVDMYDQFTMESKRRKSRKRILPACTPEHIITALSMEGHEDEMRVGLILLDALVGEKGALYRQGMTAKEQQALLTRIMAHIGDQATVISGEALKLIDGKRFLSRVRGPALIINEPSATFYSSSPNPYSSRSGDITTEGEKVFRDKSLDISYLFPFTLRPLLLPPLLLHPLPEQRHKALRELAQNLSESARQLLSGTCCLIHELLYTTGMGFMANTGSKRDCNVRVIEVNPRRDGLGPNEIFYVACRKIVKGEEILAPYNNNESKSKRMGRVKGKQKDEDDEQEAEQEAEHEDQKEDDGAAAKADDYERAVAGDGKYKVLTGTQKARIKRRERVEKQQKKRELLRLRALERSAKTKDKMAAHSAEAAEDGEMEMEDDEEGKEGERPNSQRRASNRGAASEAKRKKEETVYEADAYEFPTTDALELLTPMSSSSPSPSPTCFVSPSPTSDPTSTSPVPSFSPVPQSANLSSKEQAMEAADEMAREWEMVTERKKEQQRKREAAAVTHNADARTAPVEVIDVDADGCDEDEDDAGSSDDDRESRKGFSILRRRDSPWMPPTIYEQRTRARSAFGGELQRASDVKVVVSFSQMNKQQVAHEFERMHRWGRERK